MMPSMTSEYPINERGRIVDPGVTNDQRTYALLMHLSIIAHSIIAPLAIIITIVMWQMKKDESVFLDDHGKEAVNFQISLAVYMVAIVILAIPTIGLSLLGLAVVPILSLVGMVMGMVAANRGEYFRYPMTIRFIS